MPRMAASASVSGRKSGSAASGVSQASRHERAPRRRTARTIGAASPRSRPSERTTTNAPRDARAKRRADRNVSMESAIRVPPSQSATAGAAQVEGATDVAMAKRAGEAGQPRAEGKRLDRRQRLRQRVGEAHVALRVRLHRTGNIDKEEDAPRPLAAAPSMPARNPARRHAPCARGYVEDRAAFPRHRWHAGSRAGGAPLASSRRRIDAQAIVVAARGETLHAPEPLSHWRSRRIRSPVRPPRDRACQRRPRPRRFPRRLDFSPTGWCRSLHETRR